MNNKSLQRVSGCLRGAMKRLCDLLHGMRAIDYAGWEMFVMRLLLAFITYRIFSGTVSVTEQPAPNGIAKLFDLTFFGDPYLRHFSAPYGSLFCVCLLAYVMGRLRMIALPFISISLLCLGTLSNSQGAINHHTQPVTLIFLVQTVWCFVERFRGWKKAQKPSLESRRRSQRMETHLARQAIAAVYLVTALTKIIYSGGGWISEAENYPVQVLKTNRSHYYNTLEVHRDTPPTIAWPSEEYEPEKAVDARLLRGGHAYPPPVDGWLAQSKFIRVVLGSMMYCEEILYESYEAGHDILDCFTYPIGVFMRELINKHTIWLQLTLAAGLLIELVAPLALLGRRWSFFIGLGLGFLHLSIGHIMALHFRYNITLILVYFVNVPFAIAWLAKKVRGKRARADTEVDIEPSV